MPKLASRMPSHARGSSSLSSGSVKKEPEMGTPAHLAQPASTPKVCARDFSLVNDFPGSYPGSSWDEFQMTMAQAIPIGLVCLATLGLL